MRKIDVTPYDVDVVRDGQPVTEPFEIKPSIVAVLFSQEGLGAHELLARDELGRKIMDSNGTLLLEEAEYGKVKTAFEAFHGYRRIDVELVKRVLNAPEVKVQEASG